MASIRDEIFIIGAGSIGSLLAARLSQSGRCPTLVVRDSAQARELSENGLSLVGTETAAGIRVQAVAWAGLERFPAGAQIWITPKVFQLKDTLREVCRRIDGTQLVVLFQNGLSVLDEAQERLPAIPKAQWVRAVCWFGAKREGVSTLRVAGGRVVELGGESKSLLDRVTQALEKGAKLEVAFRGTVAQVEWRKALWNVAMNGVCAVADAPNGSAVADPFLRPLVERVLAEAAEVARREGVDVTQEDLDRVFASARETATNLNSTAQDLRAGRPTEMPWLNGAVVHKAAVLGISVPANEMVNHLVQYLERTQSRKNPPAEKNPLKSTSPADTQRST